MDTPEKTQITTSLSKFEDSPVFNYINSLSPIKPVKSAHITQTFQSLSFSSLPSIFTSPHVSSHKESRFFKRHNNTDPSKLEVSSENASKTGTDEGSSVDVAQLYDSSSQLQENFDPGVPIAVELPTKLNYDAGSPETEAVPRSRPEMSAFELSEKCLPEDETRLNEMGQTEQKNEDMECDWENLISDSADLLIFNSPIDTESFKGLMHKPVCSHASVSISSEQPDTENLSTQPIETIDPKDINQTCHCRLAANNNDEETVEVQLQAVSNLHRGMRRRCLDFEMVEASRQSLVDNSISSTLAGGQSNESIACKDEQLAPVKPDNISSRRVLPGIGLHLNALALTCKDTKIVKLENLSRGISLVSSVSSFQSPTARKDFSDSLALASEDDPTENGGLLAEDASQTSACVVTEELIQNSPKKKRRKSEGEGESCKRCNCKKSKCLKLYCECFAAGVYCIEPCSCQECFNKPIHEDTVLSTRKQIESRNPLAFAPKVIRNSEPVTEIGDESTKTPASARHKRGCNCKKSSCLKKYCECYQGGVGCSINCRCEGCKNAYGRKDGSSSTEIEAEPEEETEGEENNGIDKFTGNIEMVNNEEQTSSPALIMTPLPLCRPLLQLPFSSKTKKPSSFLGIGSSSGLYIGRKYGKPSILRPQQKQLQTVPDDDIPEILRGNCTPSTGIKTSPNGKRISPPQSNLGSSNSLKSGRKLILQSIPSFPSLTQH